MINVRGVIVLTLIWGFVLLAIGFMVYATAFAHDSDPEVTKWMQGLMQPDNPRMPCCGPSDAYWADVVHVMGDGKVYATITDDREDGQFNRHHVPLGTQVEIPQEKLKWDSGNPSGHAVVFLNANNVVLCFVQNGGY